VVFPELLRGVFAGNALEDFRAAGVFVYEACFTLSTFVDLIESDMVWEGDSAGKIFGGEGRRRENGEGDRKGRRSLG
jgi:hypothetical protein